MRTLTSPMTTAAAASQSGWGEVYDFYLKESITTPWGSSSVIRLNNTGVAVSFFKPTMDPEPTATQGDAATYNAWPVKRKTLKATSKFANDKTTIVVSNVTTEWAGMLADVEWRDVAVMVRKVNLALIAAGTATEDDHVVMFSGRIDSARVSLEQISFSLSSDMATFKTVLPREEMHTNCRFRIFDDQCTLNRFASANSKPKTATSGGTTTVVKASLTGLTGVSVTADAGTDRITYVAHGLSAAHRVRFAGTTVPAGLTRGQWYWVRDVQTDDFKVAATVSGSAIDLTSAGTAVTMDSETGLKEDLTTAPHRAVSVTADAGTDKITYTAHGLANGDRVMFGGTVVPGGLTAAIWYYVVNKATDDFKVASTEGGSAIDLTSAGTAVTMTSSAPFGADLVDALASGSITASSEQASYEGYKVRLQDGGTWKFSETPSNPTPGVDIYNPYVQFDFGSAKAIIRWEFTNGPAICADYEALRGFTFQYSTDAVTWTSLVSFDGQTASPLSYKIQFNMGISARYWRAFIRRRDGQPLLDGVIGKVKAYTTLTGGTDEVNAIADGSITSSSDKAGNEDYYVKTGNSGVWWINTSIVRADFGVLDWGVPLEGYWQIPDTQAGLTNAALKPYLQIDFGSAQQPRLWRLKPASAVERNEIPRIVQFFSSSVSNFSSATHEGNFEIPPKAGEWAEVRLHNASSARYWRICVRSLWSEAVSYTMLKSVQAFTNGRHYWQHGRIRFEDDTATVALRGVSRAVLASYANEIECVALPAAPAAGDRFIIERGCPRTFNGCCERRNEENYGGYTTLPFETVVR